MYKIIAELFGERVEGKTFNNLTSAKKSLEELRKTAEKNSFPAKYYIEKV